MLADNKPLSGYIDGSNMWRDNVATYGKEMAVTISRSYLELNLKREHSKDELQFCRELFWDMLDTAFCETDSSEPAYPYDLKTAHARAETSQYHASRKSSMECAQGIDRLISKSCYQPNFYNLEMAAMCAVLDYGFDRAGLVLAFNYQSKGYDGRLTQDNRRWADGFTVPEAFNSAWLQSHAILIDGFCSHFRKMHGRG